MMFCKLSIKNPVKEILIVSLTNIGDIIAIAPSMDVVLNDFPLANVSVIVGPKGRTLFDGNPHLKRVYVYDKHAPLKEKVRWFHQLQTIRFDAVIDFKNSLLPILLGARIQTPPALSLNKHLHLVDKHLMRLSSVYSWTKRPQQRKAIVIQPKDRTYVDMLLSDYIRHNDRFVLIAPVAQDSAKTWAPEHFAKVCDDLIDRYGIKVVMVGSHENQLIMARIQERMKNRFLALSGKTNLVQVADILNRAMFSIVHDSGIMHMASYFNRQVLALFGKTDPRLSGPWSDNSGYIWKNDQCKRCLTRNEKLQHDCMSAIIPSDVLNSIDIKDNAVVIKTLNQPCANFKMS